MKPTSTNHSTTLRFKRWSRKAYAVFASLGRAVSIGRLSVGIAEASEKKMAISGYREFRIVDLLDVNEEDNVLELQVVPALIEQNNEIFHLINPKNEAASQVATIIHLSSRTSIYLPGFFIYLKSKK